MPGFTAETRIIARACSEIHGMATGAPPLPTVRCPDCRAKVFYLRSSGVCLACEVRDQDDGEAAR